ncbi:MAG: tRNA lysidine(34) synthetase TilS [Acidobacteriota bacterium]|nr:tRNA lysidine(34) synthetase TilS [Acidobacteriota bacterium]
MQVKTELMKALSAESARPPYYKSAGLVLSVSGGVDSMVLLDVFHAMVHVHASPLKVVHIHHGTGAFADCSEALVRERCQALAIPLTVARYAHCRGDNFEYAASAFRRKTLDEVRETDQWILLAHHLQDQAETFFQAVVRGAGGSSPVGMRRRHGYRLRPFLHLDRALILDHARRRKVPHVVDPMNFDTEMLRGAVRHRVMPALRGFYGGFEERLAGWLDDVGVLQDALDAEARALFEAWHRDGLLAREAFRLSKPYLWDFILKHFWESRHVPKPKRRESDRLKHWLAAEETGSFDANGFRFYCDLDGLTLSRPVPTQPVSGRFEESVTWGPWRFRIDRTPEGMKAMPGSVLSLEPRGALSKPLREVLRAARIPYRFRENLPFFDFGGRTRHYCEMLALERQGYLKVHRECGEALRPQFGSLVPQVVKTLFLS